MVRPCSCPASDRSWQGAPKTRSVRVLGNPAGRPLGHRNKFSDAVYKDIAEAWQQHGRGLLTQGKTDHRWRQQYRPAWTLPIGGVVASVGRRRTRWG